MSTPLFDDDESHENPHVYEDTIRRFFRKGIAPQATVVQILEGLHISPDPRTTYAFTRAIQSLKRQGEIKEVGIHRGRKVYKMVEK